VAIPDSAPRPRCPFCGHALLPAQEPSNDHVFGKALGGRLLVPAHRSCNNRFGAGAEGELQKPLTLVSLLKAVHGLHAGQARVVFASGTQASLDLASGQVRVRPKVTRGNGGPPVAIEGPPTVVEGIYGSVRSEHPGLGLPAFGDLPTACITRPSPGTARMSLTLPLAAAEAMAVKFALGACTLAYGRRFAATPLAAALRLLLASATTRGPSLAPDYLGELDALIAKSAASARLGPCDTAALPRLVPAAGQVVHDVILVPYRQQTALFAHYLSLLIPPYGFLVDAPLPPLDPDLPAALPLLLRDGGTADSLEVTDFAAHLIQPVIDAARDGDIGPGVS
jgi:hypothetical protein